MTQSAEEERRPCWRKTTGNGGAGQVGGGDPVEGEDVAVPRHHLVSLHWPARLQHHPVSGLAVLIAVLLPRGDGIGVGSLASQGQGPA